MNFEQLEYVVSIANEKSISKAAKKLHISPSGVSQAISQLERELEINIFNRSRGGITLTYEGELVLSRSIEILNNLKELKEQLSDFKETRVKHMKIACAPTFTYTIHEVLKKYSGNNNEATIELIEQGTPQIINNLTKDDYDLALVVSSKAELEKENNINFEFLSKGNICIIVGKNSHLYELDYVTAEDLLHQKVIMYNLSNKGFLQLAKKYKNEIVLKSNRTMTLIELIKEGRVFTFVHNTTLKHFPEVISGELKVIPIKETDYIYQDFWLISPITKENTSDKNEFIKCVKDHLNGIS
ncbi:LysR family transcriptional regulator [Gottfriedia acidiceleris]|uniref:LysR family transcriptional regulator n=1 Tax=Gottfriedia acidiceleris TaxID=371036 RepID=UPI000B434EAE|nr:LysR family transcriptional regulator [Gottfriedia acidiceleris]